MTIDTQRPREPFAGDLGQAVLEAAALAYARQQREEEHARLQQIQEHRERALRDAEEAVRQVLGEALRPYDQLGLAVVAEDGDLFEWPPRGGHVELQVGELRLRVFPSQERCLSESVVRWRVHAILPCLADSPESPTGTDGPHLHESSALASLADLGAFAARMAEGPCDGDDDWAVYEGGAL